MLENSKSLLKQIKQVVQKAKIKSQSEISIMGGEVNESKKNIYHTPKHHEHKLFVKYSS